MGRRCSGRVRPLQRRGGIAGHHGQAQDVEQVRIAPAHDLPGLDAPMAHADLFVMLAGGTQAERNSALKRLSIGQHPRLVLGEEDTVQFA